MHAHFSQTLFCADPMLNLQPLIVAHNLEVCGAEMMDDTIDGAFSDEEEEGDEIMQQVHKPYSTIMQFAISPALMPLTSCSSPSLLIAPRPIPVDYSPV